MLSDGAQTSELPLDEGSYADFYAQLAAAVRGERAMPVDPADALEVMRLIEQIRAAAQSA